MPTPTYSDFLDGWDTVLTQAPPLREQLDGLLLLADKLQGRDLSNAELATARAPHLAFLEAFLSRKAHAPLSVPSFAANLRQVAYVGGLVLALPFALAWLAILVVAAGFTSISQRLTGPIAAPASRTAQQKETDAQAAALFPYSHLNWRV
jgi:hypothetical protein